MTVNNATVQNFFNAKDSNAGDGAIFKVGANAKLTTDGTLIDHVCTYGANVVAYLNYAEWYIKGDTDISNNFANRNDYGTIYMTGGTIKDNAGRNVNGSVFMMYGKNVGSSFYMTGGTICHNVGGSCGGIDSYYPNSVLDINRADQDFDNAEWHGCLHPQQPPLCCG